MKHAPHTTRRGAAMLMVLVAMATAMTLVVGWLASQDNSALVAANTSRAATARASAQCGLELAVSVLQSEAPWQTDHTDGWILQGYALGDSTIDLRFIDESTGLPPDEATNLVRIESTAYSGGMVQNASALATIHPFDDESLGDLTGYAVYSNNTLNISGATKIRSWSGSGRGARVLASVGPATLRGRAGLDVASGDLGLHTGNAHDWGTDQNESTATLPWILGPMGLDLAELPSLPEGPQQPENPEFSFGDDGWSHRGWASHHNWYGEFDWPDFYGEDDSNGTVLGAYQEMLINSDFDAGGDLEFDQNAKMTVEQDATIYVAGDLSMERGSAIEVSDAATLTIVVGGDVELDRAVIGGPQSNPPWWGVWKQQHIDWIDPERIRIVTAAGSPEANWVFENRSMVQAVIEAPSAAVELNRSTLLGRMAGNDINIRRGARLYFDHSTTTGQGLKALTDVVHRLDLMDLRPGGLDSFGCDEMIARLEGLLSRSHDSIVSAPVDGWWYHRPFPVDTAMTRCGGDVTEWEQAAIAAANESGRMTH